MEVRLSDFADICGTTDVAIRNAIQLNKLPFMDTQRQNTETKEKLSRRTYSVADAFGWFLHDIAGQVIPMGKWAIAGDIQSAWPFGMKSYVTDRLEGLQTDDCFLVFVRGIPNATEIVDDERSWASHQFVLLSKNPEDGSDNIERLRERYPVVISISLDKMFSVFEAVVEKRGWRISSAGFWPIVKPDQAE